MIYGCLCFFFWMFICIALLFYMRAIICKTRVIQLTLFFLKNYWKFWKYILMISYYVIRRRGVVGRVPAFHPGGPGSILDGVRNFNSYPGIGCASFLFCLVLYPAEASTLCWPHIQGGPPLCIILVFWSIENCSPYRRLPTGILVVSPEGVSPRLGEDI